MRAFLKKQKARTKNTYNAQKQRFFALLFVAIMSLGAAGDCSDDGCDLSIDFGISGYGPYMPFEGHVGVEKTSVFRIR